MKERGISIETKEAMERAGINTSKYSRRELRAMERKAKRVKNKSLQGKRIEVKIAGKKHTAHIM